MANFYHYEDIAKWYIESGNNRDDKATEKKLSRLFPNIDLHKLRVHVMAWQNDDFATQRFDWGDYASDYENPIHLAEWLLHPENDSYGCKWFRDNMHKPEIKQEIIMNASHNVLEELDYEVFERFEYLSEIWGGSGGFWITQVAFYAARLDGGDNYGGYDMAA